MSGWRFEIGTLSDLSATMFSVFLLLFVVLLASAGRMMPPTPETALTAGIARAPLGPQAMADMLYERGMQGEGTRIDLRAGDIAVVTPSLPGPISGQVMRVSAFLTELRGGGYPDPVRLYVFSNDSYGAIVQALRNGGRAWTEVSVPAALRQRGEDGTQHWREDFVQLMASAPQRDVFMRNLSRLLGGGVDHDRKAAPAKQASYGPTIAERLQALAAMWTGLRLGAIMNLLLTVIGVSLVIWIETKSRRSQG